MLFAAVATSPNPSAADGLSMQEVASGLYVHRGVHQEIAAENDGAIANIGFVVGDAAVAVIDPGGSHGVGEALRRAIRLVTALPIRYVIVTHVHPDHVFGAAAFGSEGAEVVGHARLRAALVQRGSHYLRNLETALGDKAAGTAIVYPTVAVAERSEIDLGGRKLLLTAHRTAHTDNDLTVFDVNTGTLWAGDLLFRDRIPVLDGSVTGWLAAHDELAAIAAKLVIPGHGPPTADWPAALAPQRHYLTRLANEVRAILKARGTLEQAVRTVAPDQRDRWLLFDQYHARNITAAFVELEWE